MIRRPHQKGLRFSGGPFQPRGAGRDGWGFGTREGAGPGPLTLPAGPISGGVFLLGFFWGGLRRAGPSSTPPASMDRMLLFRVETHEPGLVV